MQKKDDNASGCEAMALQIVLRLHYSFRVLSSAASHATDSVAGAFRMAEQARISSSEFRVPTACGGHSVGHRRTAGVKFLL
jgi:hypothetical protein